MPKAYFEPENLRALEEVFAEVKRRLNPQELNDQSRLDFIASRILWLASEGFTPWMILREIASKSKANDTFVVKDDANGQSQETPDQSAGQGHTSQ